jgi:quercetin dioxygenase-like cupin family protein
MQTTQRNKRPDRNVARLFLLACIFIDTAAHAQETAMPATPSVSRKDMLSALLASAQPVAKIEIKEVVLGPKLHAPLHLHPCPVVGVVLEGGIAFQIEGLPVQHLKTGDAFYEPANVRVARFDNDGAIPAKFVAFYLLDSGEQELIRLLPQ